LDEEKKMALARNEFGYVIADYLLVVSQLHFGVASQPFGVLL